MSLQKVLLVDLDGTLLKTNTFHQYIFFITNYYFRKDISKAIAVLIFVFLRLARIISHATLKHQLLKISKDLPEEMSVSFGRSLLKYQNEKVLEIINNHEGMKVLASAAPEKYTKYLGDFFKFNSTLSTKCPENNEWIENIKENKKTSLLNYLKPFKNQYILDVIVTDHHDDLPLMEIFDNIILVNPSEQSIFKTSHLKSKTKIIN